MKKGAVFTPGAVKEWMDCGNKVATVDTNHPMAGKTLIFDIEIVDVREASAEELSHGHAHGPGGHQAGGGQ